MAGALEIPKDEFIREYAWRKYKVLSLMEKENYDCVFFGETESGMACRIYAARPAQCSSFPFWPAVLINKRAWDKHALSCPGMNSGAFHSYDEILKIAVEYAAKTVTKFL